MSAGHDFGSRRSASRLAEEAFRYDDKANRLGRIAAERWMRGFESSDHLGIDLMCAADCDARDMWATRADLLRVFDAQSAEPEGGV